MKKIGLLSLAAATVVMAGGYKVPYTSLDSVALTGASVAHAKGADDSYYNPANMIWGTDGAAMEIGLISVSLSKTKFDGDVTSQLTGPLPVTYTGVESESESVLIPNFHYVSPMLDNNTRVGISVTTPAGLTKRWKTAPGSFASEEFSLKLIEVNPSVAWKISDTLAFAAGMRFVYSEAVAKGGVYGALHQDLKGDGINVGYNFALSYRPTSSLELAATYRSTVDLDMEGDATLDLTAVPSGPYNGAASASVPIPAAMAFAAAYTFETRTTVEFVLERTFWNDYNNLDFDFDTTIVPEGLVAEGVFGQPKQKEWNAHNSYRIGLTQEYDKFTAMAGFMWEKSPVPEGTLNFENPDSDSKSYALGGRYQLNDQMNVGLAVFYNVKEDRTVTSDITGIDGTFKDSTALIVAGAVEYRF